MPHTKKPTSKNKIKRSNTNKYLVVALFVVAAGSLVYIIARNKTISTPVPNGSTTQNNVSFQQTAQPSNSTTKQGVQLKENTEATTFLVTLGTQKSGISRSMNIISVTTSTTSNPKKVTINGNLFYGDTALSLPQNLQSEIVLNSKLPSGSYIIQVNLSKKSGGPGPAKSSGLESFTSTIEIK